MFKNIKEDMNKSLNETVRTETVECDSENNLKQESRI